MAGSFPTLNTPASCLSKICLVMKMTRLGRTLSFGASTLALFPMVHHHHVSTCARFLTCVVRDAASNTSWRQFEVERSITIAWFECQRFLNTHRYSLQSGQRPTSGQTQPEDGFTLSQHNAGLALDCNSQRVRCEHGFVSCLPQSRSRRGRRTERSLHSGGGRESDPTLR